MKRPNVERMRRHMARSTPDRISRAFNIDDEEAFKLWTQNFNDRMMLKHGHGRVEIHSSVDYSTRFVQVFTELVWCSDRK